MLPGHRSLWLRQLKDLPFISEDPSQPSANSPWSEGPELAKNPTGGPGLAQHWSPETQVPASTPIHVWIETPLSSTVPLAGSFQPSLPSRSAGGTEKPKDHGDTLQKSGI